MEYRKEGRVFFVRLDPGEEMVESILHLCATEGIPSAYFHGIGACSHAVVSTYVEERSLCGS